MNTKKIISAQNLESFNFDATKKNVRNYFRNFERLEWEWEKLNAQKGLTANYDFLSEYQKRPYIPARKDVFGLSSKECKEKQLKKYISSYYWAKSVLSDIEQTYIKEYFKNHKYQSELVDMLGLSSCDSREFRKLRRRAIYKFADVLNLVVGIN